MGLANYNPLLIERLEKHLQRRHRLVFVINTVLNLAFWGVARSVALVRVLRNPRRERHAAALLAKRNNEFQANVEALFGPVNAATPFRSRKIPVISETSVGALYRYRVAPKVRYLQTMGYEATIISHVDVDKALLHIASAGAVIFYRTPKNRFTFPLYEACKRLGVPTYYDIDDIIFDLNVFGSSAALKHMSFSERAEHLRASKDYIAALMECDNGIASTKAIKEAMQPILKGPVVLLENGLQPETIRAADQEMVRLRSALAQTNRVVIGYGSGSQTHDADLLLVVPALVQLLNEVPTAHLVLHGRLTIPPELTQFGRRVVHIPFLDFRSYSRAVGLFDINLAPLVVDSFSQGKSNLKFLEAALFGVPTVASPSEPYAAIIRNGENGFLAATTEEWLAALRTLCASRDCRVAMGEKARQTALTRYSDEALAAHLKQQLATHPSLQPTHTARVLHIISSLSELTTCWEAVPIQPEHRPTVLVLAAQKEQGTATAVQRVSNQFADFFWSQINPEPPSGKRADLFSDLIEPLGASDLAILANPSAQGIALGEQLFQKGSRIGLILTKLAWPQTEPYDPRFAEQSLPESLSAWLGLRFLIEKAEFVIAGTAEVAEILRVNGFSGRFRIQPDPNQST